jgi:2-polyprenyl-6-methoxyphenol hydroxylase-like FAD-dependent oxidoreductase
MANKWRVGIVGCGVAGLTAAIALGRRGHEVTLIERAPTLEPVGAGLLLQPSGQLALHRLGLLARVVAAAEPLQGIQAWTHRGRNLVRLAYRKIGHDITGHGVHRGDLFQILYEEAQRAGATFQLGVTIRGSKQDKTQIVALDSSGSEHGPFDVLIGADGARSQLRKSPGLRATVRQFPLGAAWFTGRCDSVRGWLHQVTRGTRQLIGMLPLGSGRCSLFCALPAGGEKTLRQRGLPSLQREIAELYHEAAPLVEQITSIDDLACTQYQIVRLRRWSDGRLICIGDAAHSTTPHLGQGVNLALLDALAVAAELDRANDPRLALVRAAAFRRRQVMWSWRLSNMLGPVFQSDGRLLAMGRDLVLPVLPRVPWVGKVMVGTMAGLQTGLFSKLRVEDKPVAKGRRY